ncbi:hypothetical protein VTN31DRAFT_6360 [Thermomyces dupontii]|uniref:uncharacterized protein n=1 Tax=Talaromyces thermophilus TaxID=28565 RepID=UPI0037430C46
MASEKPLRILSLDGGGIQGLSSLLILENIMEKIRDAKGLDHVPRPCEHFDLIGGTSTGGIIAIMLGRLRMTVDECIRAYRNVAQQVFTSKRTAILPGRPSGAFSATALEEAIKQTIREYCVEAECVARRSQGKQTIESCKHSDMLFRDQTCTKTAVLAITKDNVDTLPTLFKTYDTSTAFSSCTIWQVARATSAATTFFKPIKLGRDEIEFIDAGFGCNNPCEILIDEGRRQFPERSQLRVLSIGTGLGDVVTIKDSRLSIIDALKAMATSSKKVAISLDNRFGDDGQYYRFNVDQGLQDITLSDWDKASTISAHTHNYLAENRRAINKFVAGLTGIMPAGGGQQPRPGIPSVRKPEVHFSVSFGRNKNFVGRESILKELLSKIPPGADEDDCQRTAIVGLGGVGKTQIALEVAFRVHERHADCSVFWVPAINATSFENAYRHIGQLLKVGGIDEEDADVKTLVKSALSDESIGSWLLIIDNADDPDLFEDMGLGEYLPFSLKGSILFTTRNREIINSLDIPDTDVIAVEGMSEEDALKLLKTHLTENLMRNMERTTQLLEMLGYLPLAIRQAAAYMAKKRVTTARYVDLCESSDKNLVSLLSRDFEDRHRYKGIQNPVATTWLISFRQIAEHDSLAADYLKFMCFLSEKDIPQSLLPPAGMIDMEDAIGTLIAYAFITKREEPGTYDIHRLVRLAMLNWLEQEGERKDWTTNVLHRLVDVFPTPEHENRGIWSRYLPHTRYVLEHPEDTDGGEAELVFKVGTGFELLGQYREAERMQRRALETAEKVLGPNNTQTLSRANALGLVLQRQGRYEEAQALHQRALEEYEKQLGPEHPDTLQSLNNLALALKHRDRLEEAEEICRRAVNGQEKVLGPDHPHTIRSVNILGIVLDDEGKYDEAEAMYRRVLERLTKTLGPEHPNTLSSLRNLGGSLMNLGRYGESEAILRRALEGREKVLGMEHPDTLNSVDVLGAVLQRQERYGDAEAMYRRALEGNEKVLGSEHPHTLTTASNLGMVLQSQGRNAEAEAMHRRAWEGRAKVLGKNHPETLVSNGHLGLALQRQGRLREAESMYREVLEGMSTVLGPEHPLTLDTANNLGQVLQYQGRYAEAEAMFQRALWGRAKVLGFDDPNTKMSIDCLAQIFQEQEKYLEAEQMFRELLVEMGSELGPEHHVTLDTENDLAMVLQDQGEYPGAEVLLRRVLERRERVLGPDHPDTRKAANNLGLALYNQERDEEAEELYRWALDGLEQTLGPEHPDTLKAVNGLCLALQSQERYEEAESLYRWALEGLEKIVGPEHPNTAKVVENLISVLESQGKDEEVRHVLQSMGYLSD